MPVTIDPTTLPYRPCAGIVLSNRDGLYFSGERLDTVGSWQMPQGGIDAGETPLQAAMRELEEETSVKPSDVQLVAEVPHWLTYDLPLDLIGKAFRGRYRGQKQRWFHFRLITGDRAVNLATAHPEFGAWRWATADQICRDIIAFKRPLYREIFRHLQSQ